MPYLTPEFGGELDYDTGTGALSLTWSASLVDDDDVIVLCVEMQGGDGGSTPSGYGLVGGVGTGTGTAHTRGRVYVRRCDGTETGVTVPDTGNHTSASALLFRNIDRSVTLTGLTLSTFTDTTADTTQRTIGVTGSTPGFASGRPLAVVAFTTGADNHGGSTNTTSTSGSNWTQRFNDVRSGGFTDGSDGSHWTRVAIGDDSSTTQQWQMVTGNSMREARLAFYMPGHEYTEYTRSVSDSSTASDAIGRDVDFTRALVDAFTGSDAVAKLGAYTRSVADSTGLSDAVARIQGWVRSVSDAGTYSDAVGRLLGMSRSVADAGSFSDVVATDKVLFRAISDALSAADAIKKSLSFKIVDSLTSSDAVQRSVGLYRALTDSSTYSDALAKTGAFTRSVADSATSSDAVARVVGIYRAVTDSSTYSDSMTYLVAGIQAVVTATVASLVSIVTSVQPLTRIKNYITDITYSTEIQTEVEPLTDVTDEVEPLTQIEDDISG